MAVELISVAAAQQLGIKPLPLLHRVGVTAAQIVKQTVGLASARVHRDAHQVATDYDHTKYASILREKKWRACPSLAEYVFPADSRHILARVDHALVSVPITTYYRWRFAFLRQIMRESAADADELHEIGCGTGFILLSLYATGDWPRLVGYDISPNALSAATEIIDHFGLADKIHVHHLNVSDSCHPSFAGLRNKTVITHYCLEQLKYDTEAVIANLINAGVRRVIHIEPTTELLNLWKPADLINWLYITRRDYQDRLLTVLRRFEVAGSLRIMNARRLGYSPTPKHDPTLVVWEPTG